VIRPYNNWEVKHSDLDHDQGVDYPEVRLVYNYFCRINGWKDQKGVEHWSKTKMWSKKFLENNIGYRILRYRELADADQLMSEKSPLLLDGVASLSDSQYDAIENYHSRGGILWLSLPFGTHDEKGNVRKAPLSERLLKKRRNNLKLIDSISDNSEVFQQLMQDDGFNPIVRQISGDSGWVIRLRDYNGKKVVHFMNSRLKAIPHPSAQDIGRSPVLDRIESGIEDNLLQFEIETKRFDATKLSLYSPELEDQSREIRFSGVRGKTIMEVDLSGVRIYAVAQ
ncbi:MAG: hypothetical protein JJE08_10725, partial [Proteiniphilum sp.]|nr:hypothetical protein [Proteiniphilum sp.]